MACKPAKTRTTLAIAVASVLAAALVQPGAAPARLGDLDASFDGDGIATPDVGSTSARLEGVTTGGDGGPVAAGWAVNAARIREPLVVRLTPAGATAGVTRVAGTPATELHGVAIDGAGRIVAAGHRQAGAATTPLVLRFSATGAHEAGYPGAVPGDGQARAVLPVGGAILVAGWRASAQHDVFFVARRNADGSPDLGFGTRGVAEADFGVGARAFALTVDGAGRIVLAGSAGSQLALARFTAAGAPDGSFGGGDGKVTFGAGELRAVQADGANRITAAGVSDRRPAVARRLPGGDPDALFGAGGIAFGTGATELHGLALTGSRAIVAGGGGSQLLLGSLDAAGAPEPALGGALPGWRAFTAGGPAFAAALAPGGGVYTAGGAAQPYVSRHLPDAAPSAVLAAPAAAATGEPVTFDAVSSSDPEGEPLRFAFDLDGDGSFEFDGGDNPLALRSFDAPGAHVVGVRVSDPRGGSAIATRTVTIEPGPPVPRPLLGKQGVAKPLRGVVRYRLPGKRRFKRLRKLTAIPNGSEIDARKGRLLLTVLHDASGRLDGARFHGGRFRFRQRKGDTPVTRLTLTGGGLASCVRDVAARASALAVIAGVKGASKKRRVRELWGDGRGRFRTRGRYGAATVRGTQWLTLDRCDGTKVRVVRGKVRVRDVVRPAPRPQLVGAGGTAFVAAPR